MKPEMWEKYRNPKNSKNTRTDATTADDCGVMSLGHSPSSSNLYSVPCPKLSIETCKFCRKPLDTALHATNRAHYDCNICWDYLTCNGVCGKCGKPFSSQEEADMKTHEECYPDNVPHVAYYDCVQA